MDERMRFVMRLKDGESAAVPRRDLVLVDVHDHNLVLRALVRDHRHGRTAHVTGPNAQDIFLKLHVVSPSKKAFGAQLSAVS